jgi:hypothetical protein
MVLIDSITSDINPNIHPAGSLIRLRENASSPGVVTLRQCLCHLTDIAQTDYQANNQTPKSQWFAYQRAKLR